VGQVWVREELKWMLVSGSFLPSISEPQSFFTTCTMAFASLGSDGVAFVGFPICLMGRQRTDLTQRRSIS
jgi:hypothetical protein